MNQSQTCICSSGTSSAILKRASILHHQKFSKLQKINLCIFRPLLTKWTLSQPPHDMDSELYNTSVPHPGKRKLPFPVLHPVLYPLHSALLLHAVYVPIKSHRALADNMPACPWVEAGESGRAAVVVMCTSCFHPICKCYCHFMTHTVRKFCLSQMYPFTVSWSMKSACVKIEGV